MIRSIRLTAALMFIACISLTACGGSDSASSTSVGQTGVGAVAGTISGRTVGTTQGRSSGTSTTSGFTVSGTVSDLTGAAVNLTGSVATATATDSSGNFSFSTLGAGNYTIAPSGAGYVFTPVSRAAVVSTTSVTGLTFTATASTAATYRISGSVSGGVSGGVVVTLNGSNVGSTVTDASGSYTFAGVASGTYTVSAALAGYTFSAPVIVSVADADAASNNFSASVAPSGSLSLSAMTTLPQAKTGSPYSTTVVQSISGGTAPYHYSTGSLESGTPPLGMILNPSGNLTGTASVPGQYDFTVCATDAAGLVSVCQPTSISVVTAQTGPAPTVALSASPNTITAGGSSVLNWSSQNAASCSASGGWSGAQSGSGSFTVAPTSTTSYTITCTGPNGSGHAAVLVTVQAASPAPIVNLTASNGNISAGGSSTLTWSTKNATSCTASAGWTGTEALNGSKTVSPAATTTYTLNCSGAAGSTKASATVSVGTSQPPPPGTSWVYYNGTFDWPGDYSFVAVPDYADTSGAPLSGGRDIKVTLTGAWGGWLPYAQNWNFNSQGYTKLTFALKPTVANQDWSVYFVKVGDIPVGIYLDVLNYGPAPVVGQWNTYTVPLSDLGVLNTSIYKFCIQDKTGRSSNVWYVDNVGFAP